MASTNEKAAAAASGPPESAATARPAGCSTGGSVLPASFRLGLLGFVVAALLGFAIAGDLWIAGVERELTEARASCMAASLAAWGGHADCAVPIDSSLHAMVSALARSDMVTRVRWLDTAGQARFTWPAAVSPQSAPATPGASEDCAVAQAAVRGANGVQSGTVEVTLRHAGHGGATWVYPTFAAVAAATTIGLLGGLAYLNRRLRPLRAVQENLTNYGAGVEQQLSALGLSDSLGQLASAWNQLIGRIAELEKAAQPATSGNAAAPLQRIEARALRQVLDRLPMGVVRFSKDETMTYINPAAQRLLGAPTAAAGAPLSHAVPDMLLCREIVECASGRSIERVSTKDDAISAIRITLNRSDSTSGDAESAVLIEDISPLHEVERARDNFLYHVTHELRTPLTNIQAYAETLTKPEFDDEATRRECYNVIISETRRLSRLVEDILSVSQLEVGAARVEMADVDLARLMRELVQDNLGGADEKQIELTLQLPPKPPRIRGDKQRLSLLINNLVGNAVKYTPRGGRVNVTVESGPTCVRIAVTDTGIGIAPADQVRVFEKFFRAGSGDVQSVSGTGLGLAIAREVARVHGGDITLESEVGKGSTFSVELPCNTGGES
jgi:signal transduction histidine kinase